MPELAIPLVLGAMMIALLGALFIWTSRPLWRPLWEAFRSVPFVGAYIAARVEVLVTESANAGLAWARAGIAPLTQAIHDVNWGDTFYWDAATHAAQSLYYALVRVYTHALPALEARVDAYAGHLYDVAVGYATYLHLIALDFARALYQQAIAYAGHLYDVAVGYATYLHLIALDFARALYQQALAYAQAVGAEISDFARLLYAQSLAYAQALYAQALGFAEDAFGRALDYERQLYGDLVGLMEREFVLVRDYARALFDAQTLYTDAAIAGVLARVLQIERSKCQRFCEPLGDLGNLLQAVEDAGLAALLLALAAEMAHDPRGTARSIDQLIGPEVRGVTNEVAQTTGFGRAA